METLYGRVSLLSEPVEHCSLSWVLRTMRAPLRLALQHGCVVVDLAMHWRYEERPKLKVSSEVQIEVGKVELSQAFMLFIEFLIGVAIGYM